MDPHETIWREPAVRAAIATGHYGAIVRAVRLARHLTLAEVSERCNYSPSTLSRLERGRQPLADVRVLRALAQALAIPAPLLGLSDTAAGAGHRPALGTRVANNPASEQENDPMRRRTALTGATGLAGIMVLGGTPGAAATAPPLDALEHALLLGPGAGVPIGHGRLVDELRTARALFDLGRYGEVAVRVPQLLAHGVATREDSRADGIAATNVLLSHTYALTSQLMVKLGNDQLAWTSADRAVSTAEAGGDLLAHAAARRVWAIALRRAGHTDTAQQLVVDTAAGLARELDPHPAYLKTYTSLLSTAAYTAAVDGDRDTAGTLISEATDAATRRALAPGLSTTGGEALSVQLYRISMARVLGDFGTAVELAKRVDPAEIATPEARARYWSDVARALHQWRKFPACYQALLAAERAAPDEVRYRKPIQQITTSLLRNPSTATMPGLREYAQRTSPAVLDDRR
ncbi:helix-turn-helix transcriptional regulator [Nocardia sp. NPDC048505]|uniref:helix-turn-helix transcriptional regulator n=1 Tax=Nocardia sp. NPDC048505 TaxID=3155756 RepID=UPI0033CB52BE